MPATTEPGPSGNGHSRCMFCGTLNPRSLGLSFRSDGDGGVSTLFTGSHELQGYDGILHGGIIASLLDAAMTHCLFHRGVRAVTGDMYIRFLRSVECRASLRIRARILTARPPLYRLEAEMTQEEELVARASARFMESAVATPDEEPEPEPR